MSRKLNTKAKQLVLVGALILGMTTVTGCYLELAPYGPDDPYWVDHIDLKVDWSYKGSDAPTWCDALGVDRWVVELRGPEDRDVVVSCHKDFWSTENDLLHVEPGDYTVRVKALDDRSQMVASRTVAVDLTDPEQMQNLNVNFKPTDFHY